MVQNKTNVFKTCFSQNYSLASARMSRTIKKNRFYTSDMQVISITPFTGLHLQKDNVCKVITNSWLLSRVCTFKQTQTTNKHDRKVITLSLTHTHTDKHKRFTLSCFMTQRSTLGHNPCFCRTALHDTTKAAFEEAAS